MTKGSHLYNSHFEDVTHRLGATESYPGHDDGLPLNVAIPSMGRFRIWQAGHGGYTWVISYDPGLPSWSAEDRANFAGYTASYRRADQRKSSETIRIDGGPWDSFVKAENECKRTWRALRHNN